MNFGWARHALLVLGLSPALSCGLFDLDCEEDDCVGGTEPSEGQQSDFTLAGRDDESATITTPAECEDYGELRSYVSVVTTHGSDTEVDSNEWVLDRLVPELHARDLGHGRGLIRCSLISETIDYGLITSDWRKLDAIAQTILDLAAEDDVAIELSLEVEPSGSSAPKTTSPAAPDPPSRPKVQPADVTPSAT